VEHVDPRPRPEEVFSNLLSMINSRSPLEDLGS
jgi:hypothetical protein